MKLLGAARKVILVIGLLCFFSAITGITLQIHLLCHEHNDQHDHNNCDFCKLFFASNHRFFHDSYTVITSFEHFILNIQYSSSTAPGLFFLKVFNPRPPPLFV
jgi:hypothetical protein